MRVIAEISLRGGIASDWAAKNPILREGEPGHETDTHRLKIGDGATRWNSLTYVNVGEATVLSPELFEHINSELPHPIYDDGPSFDILYQNAKV